MAREKPEPTEQTMDKNLTVRVSQELLDLLEAEVQRQRSADPGRRVSASDVARSILYRELKKPRR